MKKIYEKKSVEWKKEICDLVVHAVVMGEVPIDSPPVSKKRPAPPEFDKVMFF